jgi:hypothetical protein
MHDIWGAPYRLPPIDWGCGVLFAFPIESVPAPPMMQPMSANKRLLVKAVLLLLAAAIAGYLIHSRSTGTNPAGKDTAETKSATRRNTDSEQFGAAASRAGERTKDRRVVDNAELVAQYGESRTNLSKHVTTNVVAILDDAVQMGEMMISGQGGAFGRGNGLGMALGQLNGELKMTPEQNEQAKAILTEHQRRKVAEQKDAIDRLQKNSTPLMKLILASDASFRGELQDEGYRLVQEETSKALKGVINPLDRKNFGGGSPLRDPEFVSGLRGILDPSQVEKLDSTMTRRETEAQADPGNVPGVGEGNIAGLPKMELEKLDSSIESARKVTTGIKSMMDGMGGLRELMEQPQKEGGN